jgi:hypothetical protein
MRETQCFRALIGATPLSPGIRHLGTSLADGAEGPPAVFEVNSYLSKNGRIFTGTPGFQPGRHESLVTAATAAGGALRLEAVAAINRAIARWLEGNFGGLAAGGAGRREHLTGSAEAAATAAAAAAATAVSATATAATAAATVAAAATAAARAVAGGLGSLAGFAAGLAALGFIRETAIRKPLLLIGGKSKFGAAIDAHNGFVLKRHRNLQGK